MLAAVVEGDSRSGHEIYHRTRDENLSSWGDGRYACADVHCNPADVVASVMAMREEIDELDAILDVEEARRSAFPHRDRQLRLLHSLGRRVLQAHREWIEEVERELGATP